MFHKLKTSKYYNNFIKFYFQRFINYKFNELKRALHRVTYAILAPSKEHRVEGGGANGADDRNEGAIHLESNVLKPTAFRPSL